MALATWLVTGLVVRFASRLGLVHQPNHRSSHFQMVPHGGGLGFVLMGSAAGFWLGWGGGGSSDGPLQSMLVCSLLLAIVGLADDIWQVPAKMRFGVQALSLFALLWLLGDLPALGPLNGWVMLGLVFLVGLWWVNLFNFMDGIDALAVVQAFSMLVSAAGLVAWSNPDAVDSSLWWMMLFIASATAGFLRFNWPPARIFMGDVGSLWLGFSIFALALLSIQAGWLIYGAWLILAALFVTDATVTLLTRMMRGERWYEAHRSHAYQRLSRHFSPQRMDTCQARFWGHRRVTLGALLINLFWLSPLALGAVLWPQWMWVLVVIAYLPLVAVALLVGSGRPDHA